LYTQSALQCCHWSLMCLSWDFSFYDILIRKNVSSSLFHHGYSSKLPDELELRSLVHYSQLYLYSQWLLMTYLQVSRIVAMAVMISGSKITQRHLGPHNLKKWRYYIWNVCNHSPCILEHLNPDFDHNGTGFYEYTIVVF
jgi:hypothetical protein